MTLKKIIFCIILWMSFSPEHVYAQQTIRYTEPNRQVKEALNFISLGQYQQAWQLLTIYLSHYRQDDVTRFELSEAWAQYAIKICALHLEKPLAIDNLKSFIRETSFEHLAQLACFKLARYYFSHGRFELAIPYYQLVGVHYLNNKELSTRNFELGYSYLVTQQLDKVDPYFSAAKNIPGQYLKAGTYYHGIMSYYKKDYKAAKESFEAIQNDEQYKQIIPFYLTELEYLSGDKEKALKNATLFLQSKNRIYHDKEMNYLISQIYFEKQDYVMAEKYLLAYIKFPGTPRRDDFFKLGYSQYQQAKLTEAIQHFEQVEVQPDELSNESNYFLALCYLKSGLKTKAIETLKLLKPSEAEINQDVKEFTLAKLTYDTGDDQGALERLSQFVNKYPTSNHINEAHELMTYLLMKYQRFSDALIAMNKLKNPSANIKRVYQKANFARGLQMLKEENPEKALFNFQETKKFPEDKNIISKSHFWLAECTYRLGQYPQTLFHCNQFLELADTLSLPEYTRKIHLMKAYVYLHTNENELLQNEYALAQGLNNANNAMASIGSIKPNFIPDNVPAYENDPYILIYDLPEEELDFLYKPIPLKPMALDQENPIEGKLNFLKGGFGNLSGIDLAAGIHLDEMTNTPLYFNFSFNNIGGKIKNQVASQLHVGLSTQQEIKAHFMEASLELDKNSQYYYGYNRTIYNYDRDDLKQTFQNVGMHLKATPLKKNIYGIEYKPEVYLGTYSDHYGAYELSFKTEASISKEMNDVSSIHSDILMDLNLFSFKNDSLRRAFQNNSQISWRPSFQTIYKKANIKIGLYPTLGQKFHLLPDIAIQYPITEKKLWVDIGYKGLLRLNTFKQLSGLNPFLFSDFDVKQSKIKEIFAGLKSNPIDNLCYTLRVGAAVYNQLPLFLNDTSGDNKQFNVLYARKASAFLFDGSIDYLIHSELMAGAQLHLRPLLNLSTYSEAWHYVESQFEIYGKIRATKDVVIRADMFINGGYKTIEKSPLIISPYTRTLFSGLDMNLALKYQINKKLHAYIDVNNLFGSNYQRWYGYPMVGTNVLVGLIYSYKPINIFKQ